MMYVDRCFRPPFGYGRQLVAVLDHSVDHARHLGFDNVRRWQCRHVNSGEILVEGDVDNSVVRFATLQRRHGMGQSDRPRCRAVVRRAEGRGAISRNLRGVASDGVFESASHTDSRLLEIPWGVRSL